MNLTQLRKALEQMERNADIEGIPHDECQVTARVGRGMVREVSGWTWLTIVRGHACFNVR
jgi:hypothetical protein